MRYICRKETHLQNNKNIPMMLVEAVSREKIAETEQREPS